MKVLVTGSNGFIGSHVINRLRDKGISYSAFDKGQSVVLKGHQYIIHLAGKAKGDGADIIEANTLLTISLLEQIITTKRPNPVFVFISSFAVYKANKAKLSENSSLLPRNMYGFSKLWGEEAVEYFAKKYNIPCVILRLSNVYGIGVPPFAQSVISTFIYQAKSSMPLTINGDGNQSRDFIYIEDVVDAIEKVINARWKAGQVEIFNICSGEKTSMNTLVGTIQKSLKTKVKIKYNEKVKETGQWIGSYEKAKALLHWQPKTTLQMGVNNLINL